MKTSIFKLKISDIFKQTSTRAEGIEAREKLIQLLNSHPKLTLDFAHTQITVSFIDECLGVLAENLGKERFAEKIILENISPSLRALLNHIMTRRLSNQG